MRDDSTTYEIFTWYFAQKNCLLKPKVNMMSFKMKINIDLSYCLQGKNTSQTL